MATSPTSLANKVDELSTRLAKITTEAQRISQSRDAMKIAIERIANRIGALGPKIKKITDAKKKCDKARSGLVKYLEKIKKEKGTVAADYEEANKKLTAILGDVDDAANSLADIGDLVKELDVIDKAVTDLETMLNDNTLYPAAFDEDYSEDLSKLFDEKAAAANAANATQPGGTRKRRNRRGGYKYGSKTKRRSPSKRKSKSKRY